MFGGRKCTCTSKRPGIPSPSQNARVSNTPVVEVEERAATSLETTCQSMPFEPATEGLLLLAVGLAGGQRLALVPGLLALGERDLDLGAPVLEVQGGRDDGEALLVDLALDLLDLVAVEQQLALASRGVVGPGALGVLRDVHAVQPRLVPLDVDEPVDERRASFPQRLHLRADEHQPRLVGVIEVEVVAGAPVRRDQLAPLLLRHPASLSGGLNRFR